MKNFSIATIIAMLLGLTLTFTGCEIKKRGKRSVMVESYRVPNTATADNDDDWIYWYLITQGNNYYYYSSSIPVSSFSTVIWTASSVKPEELNDPDTEHVENTEVGVNDLSDEMTETIESDVEGFGVTESDTEFETETDTDMGSTESDSGGFDSSSSDSGGDSGGGGE